MKPAFSFPIRVYWEDTDAGGVVYHASYVRFLERARTEWLRAMGIGQQGLRESEDLVLVVRAMQLDFHQPARLDDELLASVVVTERRHASLFELAADRPGFEARALLRRFRPEFCFGFFS